MAKTKIRNRWFILLTLGVLLTAVTAGAAEETGTIRGEIYVSPSGKAEGDLVMRGAGVEVSLLRDKEKFEADMSGIRNSRMPIIVKQLEAVRKAQEEFLRSYRGAQGERDEKTARLRQERAKLAELKEAYEKEIGELVAKHTSVKTEADSEGKFSFAKVAEGSYLVHAHFEIFGMGIHYHWFVPAEAQKGKETEASLNKLNATPLY